MDKYKFVNYKPSVITFYNQDRDILLNEPSLVAVSTETNKILAIGSEAEKLIGKVNNVLVGSAFKNGVVAEFDWARQMFKGFFMRVNEHKLFAKPRIAVCIPVDITQVEHQALSELILSIGGKDTLIVDKPFAAAFQDIPASYKIIIEISPDSFKSKPETR